MSIKIKISYICVIITISCLLLTITGFKNDEDNGSNDSPSESGESDGAPSDEFEEVILEQGTIRGFLEHSSKGIGFYSFLGIPYAKPPVGDLRFKDPVVADNWEGVRDGTIPPPICSQIDLNGLIMQPKAPYKGEEDCLFLNIYTSEPNLDYAELPVLVFIHGGQFVSGGANDYEPYDFMNVPVVLVVVQYRLGVLGFLSTEDKVMPGNLGLKDQTMALTWIHKNIERFGGSPVKITLFGSGAGAASVHYQTLSHRTIGLFKRAILQSGTALCPWASGAVHKEAAYYLGQHFKCLPKDDNGKDDLQENESKTENDSEMKDDVASKENERKTENDSEMKDDVGSKENENSESKIEAEFVEEDRSTHLESENEAEYEKENDEMKEAVKTNEEVLKKGDDKQSIPEVIEKMKLELEKHGIRIEDTEENKENIKEEPEIEKSEEEIKHEELMKCLQEVDVKKLTSSVELFYMWAYMPLIFGPRVDNRYLPESPEFLLKNGRHKRVDLLIGINKDDGAHLTNSAYISEGRRMALKHHYPLVGPVSLEFSDADLAPMNMTIKAYDKYAGGIDVDAKDAYNLTKMFTDRHYGVCSDLTADFHFANNERYKRNVYFYELNHRGQRSTGDLFDLNFGKEWISHGDELYYLFPKNASKTYKRDEDDEKLRDIMVKMWLLFADSGNPTPNNTFKFTWEPYTKETRKHLSLTPDPVMEEDNRVEIREFWTSLPTSQNIYFYKDYFEKILNTTKVKEDILKEDSMSEDKEKKEEDVKVNKTPKVEL